MIKLLKVKGVYEDAMMVVLSDHGEEFYDHGSWEHGHTLYNEVIKIPLVIKFPRSATSKPGSREPSLISITDIAGIMLAQSGIPFSPQEFSRHFREPNRCLPVLFPVSPIIKEFPAKISFVDDRFHFIFTDGTLQNKSFFDPPPSLYKTFELFERADLLDANNTYKIHFHEMAQYKIPLKRSQEKLKNMDKKGRPIGKYMEKKLKSLGYLSD